jgi:perosamine synthetase
MASQLALLGGSKTVTKDPGDLFTWPIITKDDETAVLDVLHRGAMSGMDVTKAFEADYAKWQGREYALGFSSGTASLQSAMYACHVGVGDEVISPSLTYWATSLQAYNLGATIVFADIEEETLNIDADDIERKITDRTKAIMVVHYVGYPADMDKICAVADKHGIPVIEDVSHAQGGLYKGKLVGNFGKVAAFSLMSGKSLAIGEAGMLVTDDREIYERAVAFGNYSRFDDSIQNEELKPYVGLPLGGYKYRMHQMSAAVGRVQLAAYNQRMGEINDSMNYFFDCLEDTPGVRPHRPSKESKSTMAGWYAARGKYVPEELGGLSLTRFCQAVSAEGCSISPGANKPLHLHPLLNTCDVYGHGKPTRIANSDRDVREGDKSLTVTESVIKRLYSIPWFKKNRHEDIDQYAEAVRKVCANYKDLLADDPGDPADVGNWHFFQHK